MMHDILDQIGCLLRGCCDEGFVFNPLGKLVDGDIYLLETPRSWLKRPNHI
jgi:hypothetical protein